MLPLHRGFHFGFSQQMLFLTRCVKGVCRLCEGEYIYIYIYIEYMRNLSLMHNGTWCSNTLPPPFHSFFLFFLNLVCLVVCSIYVNKPGGDGGDGQRDDGVG